MRLVGGDSGQRKRRTPRGVRRIYDSSIQGRERSRCIPAERLSLAARKPWHSAGGAQWANFAGSVRRWIFCGTWLEVDFFRQRTTRRGWRGLAHAGWRGDSQACCPEDSRFDDPHRGGDRNVTATRRGWRCGALGSGRLGRLLVARKIVFPSHNHTLDNRKRKCIGFTPPKNNPGIRL
jgi:hypothetical protein